MEKLKTVFLKDGREGRKAQIRLPKCCDHISHDIQKHLGFSSISHVLAIFHRTSDLMVGPAGIEPATLNLEGPPDSIGIKKD